MTDSIDESTKKLSITDEVKTGSYSYFSLPFSINLELMLKAQGNHFTASYWIKNHRTRQSCHFATRKISNLQNGSKVIN